MLQARNDEALSTLLNDPRVWRGQRGTQQPALSTGYPALDAALPQRGWPKAALSEILFGVDGVGEMQLVLPALAALTKQGGVVLLVGPPYQPYAPALQLAGILLRQLHVLEVEGKNALWASEQALRSGACAAVLCWPNACDERALRRLQLAAETGGAVGFVLRTLNARHQASPAALRVALERNGRRSGQIHVKVLKCRGGLATPGGIALKLPSSL